MRVAGLNLVAVVAAAIAIYFIGFMIYGVVAGETWMNENLNDHGVLAEYQALSAEDQANFRVPGAMDMTVAMSLGFVIALVTAIGLAAAQGLMKPKSMGEALRNAAILWFGFGATTLSYNVVYGSFSQVVYSIDLVHLLLDYLVGSAVIFLIDKKAFSGAAPTAA